MLLRRRWFLACLLYSTFLCTVSFQHESFLRSKRNTKNGCEDIEEILDDGKAAIKFPRSYHSKFVRPWMRTDIDTKVYTSKAFTYNWNWLKELKVRGLNATVTEWLSFLESIHCLPMIYGEAVRGMLLGSVKDQSALKLEVETTCDILTVYKQCVKKYGSHRCGTAPTRSYHRVTFGQMADNDRFAFSMVDPIVVSAWNMTFNRPQTEWEFTANSLGLYDNTVGKVFIIDLTSRSVTDVCKHVIALPVELDLRGNWTNDNLVKVLRYFNLKADAFNARDGVRNFILRTVTELFDRLKFQEYYCRFVYDGIFVVPTDEQSKLDVEDSAEPVPIPECRVVSPDSRSARLISITNATMEKDFGDYWNHTMLSALSGINYVNLEDQIFLEGAPTQATWPIYVYETIPTTTTTVATTTTEEYPGDSKIVQDEFVQNDFVNVPSEEYSPYSDPSGAASADRVQILSAIFVPPTSNIAPVSRMSFLKFIKMPVIDIVASVVVWYGTTLASAYITPATVGFACDDVSIRKPRVPEIVSSTILHWTTLLIPIVIFIIVELVKIYFIDHDEEFADGETRQSKLTRVALRVVHIISWHFLTMAITELLTTVAKLSVGRLRPTFLEACRPALDTETCANRPIYITHYECTDPKGSSIGARKSFFSGHSSNSMAAATFVVVYIQSRLGSEFTTRALIPLIQALIFSAGLFVGFSRYVDHSHHWSDILVGQTVGTVVAFIVILKATPLFKKDKFY